MTRRRINGPWASAHNAGSRLAGTRNPAPEPTQKATTPVEELLTTESMAPPAGYEWTGETTAGLMRGSTRVKRFVHRRVV